MLIRRFAVLGCLFLLAGCSRNAAFQEDPVGTTININCGAGSAFTDENGVQWTAERGFFDGAAVADNGVAASNPDAPLVCRSEHYGMSCFWVPVPNGRYIVKLTFCESYNAVKQAGQRVFKVDVEGQNLGEIDPCKEVGLYKPLVKQVDVHVFDGKLDVEFESMVQNPQVNAIQITPVKDNDELAAPVGYNTERDVPHGKVALVSYPSKTIGTDRPANVYTPPGYDASQKYPVLILLHGGGGSELSWEKDMHLSTVMDNLIAQGKVVPMIVVMPNGYVRSPNQAAGTDRVPGAQRDNYIRFENDVVNDLIPYIDSHYSTFGDADHRALAGLSMGAGQVMWVGPRNTDKFTYLGMFSGGLLGNSFSVITPDFPDAKTINERIKLFWVSTGDHDRYFAQILRTAKYLNSVGVKYHWKLQSGSHEVAVWGDAIYLLSQRLFK